MEIDRALVWFSDVWCRCGPTATGPADWLTSGLVHQLPEEIGGQLSISQESVIGTLPLRLERFSTGGELTIGSRDERRAAPLARGRMYVATGAPGEQLGERGPEALLIVSVAFDFHGIRDPDLLIALTQSFEKERTVGGLAICLTWEQESVPDCVSTSLHDLMRRCGERLLTSPGGTPTDSCLPAIQYRKAEKFRVIELRGWHDDSPTDPSAREADDAKRLYGLLAGDEGWRDVPRAHATEVLERGWSSSREFLRVMVSGSGVLVVNDKFGGSYVDHADGFYSRLFGTVDPYFRTDFSLAGLDHGVLFAMERNTYWMATARALEREFQRLIPDGRTSDRLRRASSLRLPWSAGLTGRLQSARLDQIRFRGTLPNTTVGELASLEDALFAESGLAEIVFDLDQTAASMDDVTYGLVILRLNLVILIVTIFTFVVALATWLYQILS